MLYTCSLADCCIPFLGWHYLTLLLINCSLYSFSNCCIVFLLPSRPTPRVSLGADVVFGTLLFGSFARCCTFLYYLFHVAIVVGIVNRDQATVGWCGGRRCHWMRWRRFSIEAGHDNAVMTALDDWPMLCRPRYCSSTYVAVLVNGQRLEHPGKRRRLKRQ